MQKIILGLVIVLALFATSCDRFEHTFKPAETIDPVEVLFDPLQTAFNTITATDVSEVIAFYDEDYLHNGQQKSDREAFYLSLFQSKSDLNFDIELIATQPMAITDTLSTVTWRLTVTDIASQVVADSTFFGEQIIKSGNTWLLYGNRDYCCPPILYKQRVLIEDFTYITCPNCPVVSGWLHQLQEAYPNKLSYLAYHMSDPLDVGNLDVYSYYDIPSMPTVVFQGETKIIGNNTENETLFNQLANQISDTDSQINLTNLDFVISGQNLSGTVRLNVLNQNLDTTQLKLKYAIIDRESANYTYLPSGNPCYNVVIAKGTKPLLNADLEQSVSFNLPIDNLPLAYAGNLPIDSYLVIWVQLTPDPFNNNATIYNALEAYIPVNKRLNSNK